MKSWTKMFAACAVSFASVAALGGSSIAQAATPKAATAPNYAPKPLKVHQTITVSVPNLAEQNSAALVANYF
jgi:hypothetical protein